MTSKGVKWADTKQDETIPIPRLQKGCQDGVTQLDFAPREKSINELVRESGWAVFPDDLRPVRIQMLNREDWKQRLEWTFSLTSQLPVRITQEKLARLLEQEWNNRQSEQQPPLRIISTSLNVWSHEQIAKGPNKCTTYSSLRSTDNPNEYDFSQLGEGHSILIWFSSSK